MTILPLTQISTTLLNYKGEVVILHYFSLHPSIWPSLFWEILPFVLVDFCPAFSLSLLISEAKSLPAKLNFCLRFGPDFFILISPSSWRSQIFSYQVEMLSSLSFFLQTDFVTKSQEFSSKVWGCVLWRSQIPNSSPSWTKAYSKGLNSVKFEF